MFVHFTYLPMCLSNKPIKNSNYIKFNCENKQSASESIRKKYETNLEMLLKLSLLILTCLRLRKPSRQLNKAKNKIHKDHFREN